MAAFELEDPDADRALGRGQARELLAMLCASRGEPLGTQAIVDGLWGSEPPPTAPTIVHGAVAKLRKVLGSDVVCRTDDGYLLDQALISVDLWAVGDLARAGRLAEARGMIREPLLGPFADRPWAASVMASARDRVERRLRPDHGFAQPKVGGAPVTRLIGRRKELASLREAHRRSRLVTLVGLGGVGKSRLASELVVDLSRVARVDLGLASGSFAVRLAAELGTVATGDPDTSLLGVAAVLQQGAEVLLLDGCEHDLDGAADGIAFLLQHCAALRVVATSRTALGIPGEQVVPLLPFADAGDPLGDGVELVLDRLRGLGLPFDPDDRLRAAAISARCAGVPLAIELAAAEVLAGAWPEEGGSAPGEAVRAVVDATIAALGDSTVVAARRAALLPAGITPSLLTRLGGAGSLASRELLAAGVVGVEGTGARRRLRFPDSVRDELLRRADDADLGRASVVLAEVGASARESLDKAPVIPALAEAISEITNAYGLIEALEHAGRHDEQLALALAFATPWREDGHWASGSEAIERALLAAERDQPVEPTLRAEVVLAIVTVAGTYEVASRRTEELRASAEVAMAGGRPDLAAVLRVHEANGLGYVGRIAEATAAVVAAEEAAASGSPVLRIFPATSRALGLLVTGRATDAHLRLAELAERCAEMGAHSDAARVGRLAAMAARTAGDLPGALTRAEIAEEQAELGMARGTLAIVRAELADLRFAIDPATAGPALAASLESALATGQVRTIGQCRLRLGLLDDDLAAIATAAVELLAVDGRLAALCLAHVLDRLPPTHLLRPVVPGMMAALEGWGAPLAPQDDAYVRGTIAGADPADEGWEKDLVGALLEL